MVVLYEQYPVEDRLVKLNRANIVRSAFNQAVIHLSEPQSLFEAVCRIAVEHGGYRLAWVSLFDSQTKNVRLAASAGETNYDLQKTGFTADEDENSTPTFSALRAGKPVVVNDIAAGLQNAPWRAAAWQQNYHALAVFPFCVSAETRGAFTLYSSEKDVFDEQEISLWDEIAGVVAFALGFSGLQVRLKRAEEAKNQMDTLYQVLVEQADDALFVHDFDGKLIEVNQQACESLGYSKQELLSMTVMDVEQDFDLRSAQSAWAEIDPGAFVTLSGHQKRKDGTIFPVEARIGCSVWKGQKLFIGLVRDIAERKHTQQEIRRFSRIFEDSLNEIYLFDAGTLRFTQVNKAALINLGYALEEIKNMTPLDIKPALNEDAFSDLVAPLRNGEKEQIVFETIHQRKNGTTYQAEVHLQLLKFDDDVLFAAVILDITERKRIEAKINEQLEELRRWNKITLGREERILELKREINRMLIESGKLPRYGSVAEASHE